VASGRGDYGSHMSTSGRTIVIRGPERLLFVDDVERSVKFYCDQLGFKLTESWRPDEKLCWCRVERGGAALMLQQACAEDCPAAERGRGVVFYFLCVDANAIHAEFTAAGLNLKPPEVAFYGMNQLSLTDPDCYSLCFQNLIK
jgi:uncharacterized glyoxalase superfamily protein PhnB